MDRALELRMKEIEEGNQENDLLEQSPLLKKLISEFKEKPLYAIWRVIALSEIPHADKLPYTQKVISYIKQNLFTEVAFSFTGSKADIVPCYNAMLIEAFSKLGEHNSTEVQRAIQWIKDYQFFHRGGTTTWDGKGIQNYGGCLKSTPCFIGIAKTLKALLHYNLISKIEDVELDNIIEEATNYIKKHEFCYRLSSGKPISNHILQPAFPASYVLSIVELLEIAYLTGNINDTSTQKMILHLKTIRNSNGNWGVGYQYKNDGYISFDGGKKNAEWITFLINKYLN